MSVPAIAAIIVLIRIVRSFLTGRRPAAG